MNDSDLVTWATVASSLSTLLLVGLSAYYAFQNNRIFKEMEKSRELGLMPLLTAHLEWDVERSQREGDMPLIPGEYNKLRIRNVGNAPAIGTKVILELLNPQQSALDIKDQAWAVGTVGVEESESVMLFTAKATRVTQGQSEPRLSITMTFLNIYQKSFQTYLLLERQPSITDQKRYPLVWAKLEERTPIAGK